MRPTMNTARCMVLTIAATVIVTACRSEPGPGPIDAEFEAVPFDSLGGGSVVLMRFGGTPGVFRLNVATRTVTKLPSGESGQRISPNGGQYAAADAVSSDPFDRDIYLYTLNGNRTRLTTDDSFKSSVSWSRDGTKLFFLQTTPEESSIVRVTPTPGALQPVVVLRTSLCTAYNTGQVSESPTGLLLFLKHEPACGPGVVHSMNGDGSSLKRLTSPDGSAVFSPVWSPDGTRIAYGKLTPKVNREFNTSVVVMNADGSNPVTVANLPSSTQTDIIFL